MHNLTKEILPICAGSQTRQFRKFVVGDAAALANLFASISADASATHYRPHAFDTKAACRIANYSGRDIYVGAWTGYLCGYGMLRGWDDGFETPSLGIYVLPEFRGKGLAQNLMRWLETCAIEMGALRIRLRVGPTNTRARGLYDKVGYRFDGTIERGEYVGILDLKKSPYR